MSNPHFCCRALLSCGAIAALTAILVSSSAQATANAAGDAYSSLIAATSEHGSTIETIRERYPSGRVKIEREVTTDADGNYVNHGAWQMWNPAGKLVAEGAYDLGRRAGNWTRWFAREGAAVLATVPLDQFEAPFVSRARFVADQLEGEWTIADAAERKCSCVSFKNGKRDGTATLWLPDGKIYREATFRNGLPVGDLRERSSNGELTTIASYVGGQQLLRKVSYFPDSKNKQVESMCLAATTVERAPDDYWQLRFAEYGLRGENLRHGSWKSWYSNGKPQAEGHFQFDREAGTFTWWHAHGQEAVKGDFTDGRPDGTWTWWHANGQKAAEGRYDRGEQVGTWRQWADDGRLVLRQDGGTENENRVESALSGTPQMSQNTPVADPGFWNIKPQ